MSGYFKVPNDIAEALIVSDPTTFRLYCLIAFRAAYRPRPSAAGFMLDVGECDLTQNQMANALGVSRKRIINGTSKLTSMGALTVHQRGHRRNIVRLELAGACEGLGTTTEHQRVQEGDIRGDKEGTSKGTLSKTNTKKKTNTNFPPSPPQGGGGDDPDFVAFWAAYPRKVGKGQARRAWRKALKAGIKPSEIMQALQADPDGRLSRSEAQYIPHPSTWLNSEPWEDQEPEQRDVDPVTANDWHNCRADAQTKAMMEFSETGLHVREERAWLDRRIPQLVDQLARERGLING